MLGEDVEDAGETNQRRKFRDTAARKFAQIEFALLLCRRHRADLTTAMRRREGFSNAGAGGEVRARPAPTSHSRNCWDIASPKL